MSYFLEWDEMTLYEFGQKIRKAIKGNYSNLIEKFVTFDLPDDPKYSEKETIHLFSTTGIRNSYLTTVARNMRIAGHNCQTGETALDRIKPLNSARLFEEMKKSNDSIIGKAVERGEFKGTLVATLDTHNVYRHSKIAMDGKRKRECSDIKTVVGTKPKDGSCYAHKYMTIQNVKMENEPPYVLSFGRVLPLQNETEIARTLLKEAESKVNATIGLVIADGGFDDIDSMSMFKEEGKHFVVRADQDKRVKKVIGRVEEKGKNYHVEFDYIKGNKKHGVNANLVVIDIKWLGKQGIKYPLKKKGWISFYTDLYPEENESLRHFCLRVALYYKKRWGIETGYRCINDFKGQTHSLYDSIRLFLYLQAILLYNLWIQINLQFKDDPDRKKYFRDGIPKSTIKFVMEELARDWLKERENNSET